MWHPMRLELTLAGLLVKVANHYTTRGALVEPYFFSISYVQAFIDVCRNGLYTVDQFAYVCF